MTKKRKNYELQNKNYNKNVNLIKKIKKLSLIISNSTIKNINSIFKNIEYLGDDEYFLENLAEEYVNLKLKSIEKYASLINSKSLTYDGINALIEVTPNNISGFSQKQKLERKILELDQKINSSCDKNTGIIYFLPFLQNSSFERNYIQKEIKVISFVNLPYNPKQICQRAYNLKNNSNI